MTQANATIDSGLFINTPTAADRTTAAMNRRALFGALIKGDIASPNGLPKPGIFPMNGGTALKLTAVTGTMNATVGPGWALAQRASSPTLGGYVVGTDTTVTIGFDPGDGTNYRVDLVYAQQVDPEAGDAGHAQILVVKGSASQYGTTYPNPITLPAYSAWPDGAVLIGYALILPTTTQNPNVASLGGQNSSYLLDLNAKPAIKTYTAIPTDLTPFTRGDRILLSTIPSIFSSRGFLSTGGMIYRFDGTQFLPSESKWYGETTHPGAASPDSNTWGGSLSMIYIYGGSSSATGNHVSRWRIKDGEFEFESVYTFASGDTFTSNPEFLLFQFQPIFEGDDVGTPNNYPGGADIKVQFERAWSGGVPGKQARGIVVRAANRLYISAERTDSTYETSDWLNSSTVPWAWAAGDRMVISGRIPLGTVYGPYDS